MEEDRWKDRDWEIVMKSVYRRDRDDRLKRAYELVHPDTLIPKAIKQRGGENGKDEHRPLCSGVKQ
jgi:hypothetical protein